MKRKLLSLVLAFAMMAGLLTVGAGTAGPAYGDAAQVVSNNLLSQLVSVE